MSISVCSLCDSGMPEILKLCRLPYCSRSSVLMSVSVILSSSCIMSCFKGCITSAIRFSREGIRCSISFAFISGIPTSADTKRSVVSLLLSAPRIASRSTSASSPMSDVSLERKRLRCSDVRAEHSVFCCLLLLFLLLVRPLFCS